MVHCKKKQKITTTCLLKSKIPESKRRNPIEKNYNITSSSEMLRDDILLCYFPGFVPAETLDVHQYSKKLWDAECWMCVIHLHSNPFRECFPVDGFSWSLLKACNNILKWSRAQCILLLQSESFPLQCFITRVQYIADLPRTRYQI